MQVLAASLVTNPSLAQNPTMDGRVSSSSRHAGQEVLPVLRRRAHHRAGGPLRQPRVVHPKHLAEKILTSRAALEGERKQVTVPFADLKGSMELLADRDPKRHGSCSTR